MNNNLFDKHVKEQMDGLRPDVGSHIWENIAKKMEEKKPAAFWSSKKFLLMMVLFFITIAAGIYLFTKTSETQLAVGKKQDAIKNNVNVEKEITNSNTKNELQTNNKNTVTNNNKFDSNKNNKNKITSNQNDIAAINNTIINIDKINANSNKGSTTNNKKTDAENKTNPIQKYSSKKANNAYAGLSTASNKVKNESTTASNNIGKQKINRTLKSNVLKIENNLLGEDATIVTNNRNKKRITKSKKLIAVPANENINEAIEKEQLEAIVLLQPLANALEYNTPKTLHDTKIIARLFPIIPCPEIEKNAAGNKKYVEFYAGPDYIFRSFSDTGSTYADQRKASTGIHYAFSAGLRYTKVFGNGVSIRTGINYSQMNERFIGFKGYILERIIRTNATGDTIANFTQSTIQYEKSTNIYRSIDIPFQLGYEMGNGRLHTNIGLGVNVNIASRQTGLVLDDKGKPVDISTGAPSSIYQFKTNAGVSFLGSVSFYYKLNDHWHVMLEPYIRYSLSPYTKPDITFKQKFNAAGLRFGVRWDF